VVVNKKISKKESASLQSLRDELQKLCPTSLAVHSLGTMKAMIDANNPSASLRWRQENGSLVYRGGAQTNDLKYFVPTRCAKIFDKKKK